MSLHTTRERRRFMCAGAVSVLAPVEILAAEPLPVGIVAEPTLLTIMLRIAAIAVGAALLISGVRRPVAALMAFYLALGLAVGLVSAAETAYLLSIGVTVGIIVVAAAIVTWARRVATGVACLWPLPAAYAVHLYFSGSFERSLPLAIGLAVGGAALGAVWPRAGAALLASALGTALVLTALPWRPSEWSVFGISAVALLWQLVLLDRALQSPFQDIPSWPGRERRAPRIFTLTVRNTTAVLAVLIVAVVFLAPQYGPASGPHTARLVSLVENGLLNRPALVLSRGDNLYLSGRAASIAIAAPHATLLSRLALPLVGRSASRAIHRLRAVKTEEELEKMRTAAAITSRAFVDIAPKILRGVGEGAIEAAILESFRRGGATGVAFDSIVGSGANATLPHYAKNDTVMTDGMVVIDIGCSVDGYASDMTRTFPVNGTLTPQQKEIVDVVNSAGDAARAALRAGVTMRELDTAAREVIDDAGFGPYFLHGLGHHLGLDVHDPHATTLETGMVITIEPGIYISSGSDIDPAYWNLGVRIEDSYIVTDDGYEEITSFPR